MKVYTVHFQKHDQNYVDDIILILEGFSWSAFFLNVIWTLWYRMWLASLGLACLSGIIVVIINALGMGVLAVIFFVIGTAVLYGFVANDLRRWSLSRIGFLENGVTLGKNQDEALARFLDKNPDTVREIF
jgi:hypothetical protein